MMQLKEYLFREDITAAAFARKLGCSQTHIYGIKQGRLVPGLRLARDIEKLTGGKVTVSELRPEK